MSSNPLAAPQPQTRTLEMLMADIREARDEVRSLRRAPVAHDLLHAARVSLLRAMEAYADELTVRSLPIPRKLHDDIRLARRIRR